LFVCLRMTLFFCLVLLFFLFYQTLRHYGICGGATATPSDFSLDLVIFYTDLVIFRSNLVTFVELDSLKFPDSCWIIQL